MSVYFSVKKFPLTIIPVIVIIVIALLYIFVVPKGGDLISSSGDTILGVVVGIAFGVCLLNDIKSFKNKS